MNDRKTMLANALRAQIEFVLTLDTLRDGHKSALADANADTVSGRASMLLGVATTSSEYQMTFIELDQTIKVLTAEYKHHKSAKTVQTFASEMRLVGRPEVRFHADDLYSLVERVWDDEQAQDDKDAPRPLKTAFARKYHAWMAYLQEAAIGRIYTSPDEVIAFAHHRDPAYDAGRVLKRRDQIENLVRALADDCAVSALANIASDLAQITETDIKANMRNQPALPKLAYGQGELVMTTAQVSPVVDTPTVVSGKRALPSTIHTTTSSTSHNAPNAASHVATVDVLDSLMEKLVA